MTFDQTALGRRIRAFRKACSLSQSELGEKIGVTYQQVQKYEKGASSISALQLLNIAEALSVPVERFFTAGSETGEHDSPYSSMEPDSLFMKVNGEERRLLQKFRTLKSGKAKESLLLQLKALQELEESLTENS